MIKPLVEFHCLHGFLGEPSDWDFLKSSLAPKGWQWYQHSLFGETMLQPSGAKAEWSKKFHDYLNSKMVSFSSEKLKILVGYSMGGRLALQSFFENQTFWDAAIFISTHPGLLCLEEKISRQKSDLEWARRFLNEDWQLLYKSWNQQTVFKNFPEPIRLEENFSRDILSAALKNWSLAHQENYADRLQNSEKKYLWIIGGQDEKFLNLAIQKIPKTKTAILEGQGHRLIFAEKIQPLADTISNFVDSLNPNLQRP